MQQQKMKMMTKELIDAVYRVLEIEPPNGRCLNKVVITLEGGKPVMVEERTYPVDIVEVPDELPVEPAAPETAKTE